MKNLTVQMAAYTLLATALATSAVAEDIAGSADHPLIGRFEGSHILAYDYRDFDEYAFPNAPAKKRDPENAKSIEGVVTRIAYTLEGDQSLAEVARNFELGLTQNGFEILFECKTKECGGGNFAYALDTFPLPKMVVDPFNFRYLGARRSSDGGETYASVVISADTNRNIRTQVTVVELDNLAFQMVDAKAMQEAFAEKGSITLYGIYFDTDKADIKPESAPTLEEMAKFLKTAPDLSVVIVGHTDNQGAMDYNLNLSQRRAQAVVDALSATYGIGADRLVAAGAGFLAPVAPNDSEDGRAQNRRVEMIPR
ncbi:OmpA family protein [Hoeflea prorocentri]|uniref:OmpA family protein n=1 Tax=Hoeflea prorocentri TaxID=1922333 RepID=A0A9X3ZGB2_9HYPH|nr:OmpA family protein [Hoeflea prorocentri]MCY6380039.1 OmpA family protein [Hoeflea prorocentri]MDA5397839.1 OmpA family protein [Hoeflea prorocentri]